jgi:hypothetical protein
MPSKPKTSDAEFNTRLLSIIGYLFGTTVRNSTPPAVIPTVASRLNISATDLNSPVAVVLSVDGFLSEDHFAAHIPGHHQRQQE